MLSRSTARVASSALFAALALAGGCSSDYSMEAASDIRDDPSPDMDTLYQRPVDVDNTLAVVTDTNWRMFNQDMGRFWLLDRPSILTIEPMPHY